MASPERMRFGWLRPAALVLLVSLHFWFPDVGPELPDDTFSATAAGKKAFYLLLRERADGSVFRNTDRLSIALASLGPDDVLCILGPARYPTDREWTQLLDWVADGGRLMIAAREKKPDVTIKRLGIKVRPAEKPAIKYRRHRKRPSAANGTNGSAGTTKKVSTGLVETDDLTWRSAAEVIAPNADRTLVRYKGRPQAVTVDYGNGTVTVVASDFVFSNESIAFGEQADAELAFRLIETTGPVGTVCIDESLNRSGTPKVVGLLFDPFLRPVTVQLLILLLLFTWWRSRRFGPVLPVAVSARHNIVDHTDAAGLLNYRSKNAARALRGYLRELFAELKLKSFRGREDRVLEPIAVRMGLPLESLRNELRAAVKASRTKTLERKQAAAVIRRLSRIRAASRAPVERSSKP